jgi:hypothetical protein
MYENDISWHRLDMSSDFLCLFSRLKLSELTDTAFHFVLQVTGVRKPTESS